MNDSGDGEKNWEQLSFDFDSEGIQPYVQEEERIDDKLLTFGVYRGYTPNMVALIDPAYVVKLVSEKLRYVRPNSGTMEFEDMPKLVSDKLYTACRREVDSKGNAAH